MFGVIRSLAVALLLAGASFGGGVALAQGAARLALFDRVALGLWEVRMRDTGSVQRICVDDARRLIQLRHPDLACRQFVVENEANSATVQYVCSGQGTGRTHFRFESARLLQIESQGIASKTPFDFSAEARRIGDCAES